MKTLSLALLAGFAAVAAMPSSAEAQTVNGYYRSNGTYVAPHMRSAPDGNPYNNYGYGR